MRPPHRCERSASCMSFRLASYPSRLSCPGSLPQPDTGYGSASMTIVGKRCPTPSAGTPCTFTRAVSATNHGAGLSHCQVAWPMPRTFPHMKMKYNHIGIPTTERFEGEIDLPHLKVTVSDHANSPLRYSVATVLGGRALPRAGQNGPARGVRSGRA